MGQWCSTCVHISFLFHTSRMAWNNFPSISEFFFFMFQIMIIPTLEELLCNERTLYKRLVFSLLLLSHYPEAFSEDTEHCAQSSLTPPQASHLQPYCTALCSFDIDCPPSCLALTLLLLWALPWDTFCPLSQSS